MSSTYRGPSDNLIVSGKLYHVGDTVPLGKDERRSLELTGHRFDDTDFADVAFDRASRPGPAAETAPRGDRGEVIDVPEGRKGSTDPVTAATVETAAKSK